MATLWIIQGPDQGQMFEIPDNEPQLIGRSSEALAISDLAVSRCHAELTPDRGSWWIRDLDSQNGTFVNNRRITTRTTLAMGDQIRVGATVLAFGKLEIQGVSDMVQFFHTDDLDVEHTLVSNEDSVILGDPEPAKAAVEHLRVIYRLTAMTTHVVDEQHLLQAVMDLIFNEFEPQRGFILRVGPDGSLDPVVVKHRLVPKDKADARINVSRTIIQHALSKGEGILSSNAMSDPRFAAGDSVQRFAIRSALCAPILFRERTFGAIYIDSSIAEHSFTPEQLALMNAIGQHTALAMLSLEQYAENLQRERLAAIGQTVASLSHSIKNILQGLQGGGDVVEMGLKRGDLKITEGGWGILKRNLDRIIALTLNMLTFSRQRTPQIELTKLGPLVEECAQLLETQCQAKQIAMIVDTDPEMPPIPIDPHMIHQALMNLMTNAVEAIDPDKLPEGRDGAVTVRTTYNVTDPLLGATPAYAQIDVIDNGHGVAADRLDWIFQPFNSTRGQRGTGLGLAVTKSIVDQHRGRIQVNSSVADSENSLPNSTVFRIILPVDPEGDFDPAATADSRQKDPNPLREV